MLEKDFITLQERKFQRAKALMFSKNDKYDHDEDTLKQFKDEAQYLGESPFYRCFSHMVKHVTVLKTIALKTMGRSTAPRELDKNDYYKIVKKCTDDIVNYASMLEALIKEESQVEQ